MRSARSIGTGRSRHRRCRPEAEVPSSPLLGTKGAGAFHEPEETRKFSRRCLVDPIPLCSLVTAQDEFVAISEDASRGVEQATEGKRGEVGTGRVDGQVDQLSFFDGGANLQALVSLSSTGGHLNSLVMYGHCTANLQFVNSAVGDARMTFSPSQTSFLCSQLWSQCSRSLWTSVDSHGNLKPLTRTYGLRWTSLPPPVWGPKEQTSRAGE